MDIASRGLYITKTLIANSMYSLLFRKWLLKTYEEKYPLLLAHKTLNYRRTNALCLILSRIAFRKLTRLNMLFQPPRRREGTMFI